MTLMFFSLCIFLYLIWSELFDISKSIKRIYEIKRLEYLNGLRKKTVTTINTVTEETIEE